MIRGTPRKSCNGSRAIKWSLLRHLFLMSSSALCIPLTALAQDEVGMWYVNPYGGGITPDKPWGGKGSTALAGLDIGTKFSAAWSAELDLNGARLNDRFRSGHTGLYGGALDLLRIFNRGASFAPYLSIGAGLTHDAPPSGTSLESRTEFMTQPGLGAIIKVWQSADGAASLALRPTSGRDPQLDAAIAETLQQLKTAQPAPLKSAPPVSTQVGK